MFTEMVTIRGDKSSAQYDVAGFDPDGTNLHNDRSAVE
jgi:hypothetical protein